MSIEEHIRRAMEEGKFDDLPGKGKPLPLEDYPFEEAEWRVAHHLLRSAGFSLPWIEERREIEETLQAARQALQRAWLWRQQALRQQRSPSLVEAEWQRALAAFHEQIQALNQRILTYNLHVPSIQFQRLLLDEHSEVERLKGA
jgi:DnaJ family protein C protein 28